MGESGYRKLRVRHLGMDVVEAAYSLTSTFPKQEIYGIASEIQRAAVSIPSNIADCHSRDHLKESFRFVSNARGSVGELDTQRKLARRISATDGVAFDLLAKLEDLSRQLTRLRSSLQKKLLEESPTYDIEFAEISSSF